MKRKELVLALRVLLSDEFNSDDWIDKSEEDLIYAIIDAGLHYKQNN